MKEASPHDFWCRVDAMLLIEIESIACPEAQRVQQRIVEQKVARGGPDVLLIVEHPPTVTIGVRGQHSDLLMPADDLARRGITVCAVDRGGQATYHGPGQVVCYPIVDLRSWKLSAKEYVRGLEETVIRTLAVFEVPAFRQRGKPGVWTGEMDKIASVGVRIRNRVTYHGFSLNVDLAHDPCELVISCGMADVRMVSLNRLLTHPVSMTDVRSAVRLSFCEVFDVTLEPAILADVLR